MEGFLLESGGDVPLDRTVTRPLRQACRRSGPDSSGMTTRTSAFQRPVTGAEEGPDAGGELSAISPLGDRAAGVGPRPASREYAPPRASGRRRRAAAIAAAAADPGHLPPLCGTRSSSRTCAARREPLDLGTRRCESQPKQIAPSQFSPRERPPLGGRSLSRRSCFRSSRRRETSVRPAQTACAAPSLPRAREPGAGTVAAGGRSREPVPYPRDARRRRDSRARRRARRRAPRPRTPHVRD